MAASAAGWATVSLAGCSDTGGNGGGGTTTGDGGGTSDVTVTTQTTTTEGGGSPSSGDGGSSGGDGGGGTTQCTQSAIFAPGMDVGFLVSVFDDVTGDTLTDENVASVELSFPDADFEPVTLSPSGPHEKHVDEKWGGKLSVPVDAQPGTYKYEVSVAREPDETPEPVAVDELKLADLSL